MDIAELIRSIIWGLMLCILNIVDVLWEAAKLICGLDFSGKGLSWIWNWFVYIELFFVLFIVFRIIKVVFKAFTDEEYMQKLNPGQWLIKLACAVVIMSAVPFCMKEMTGLVNSLVSNIAYFTDDANLYNSQKISTLLVDCSSVDLSTNNINATIKTMKDYINEQVDETTKLVSVSKETFKGLVKNYDASTITELVPSITNKKGSELTESQMNKVYKAYLKKINESVESQFYGSYWYTGDVNDIDINAGEEDGNILEKFADTVTFGLAGAVDKVYYMYPSWSSLFFGLITIIAVAFIFIPILIQMAQRVVSMVIKLFLAPYAISGLVDPENQTYATWCKYMIADLISNFFQLYSMMILFAFIGSSSLDAALKSTTVVGTVAKIALILGGLLAVYSAPSGVAAIIGGSEMSAANTLNQVQSLLMFGAIGTGVGVAGGALGIAGGMKLLGAGAGLISKGANRLSSSNGGSRLLGGLKGNSNAGGIDGFGGNADGNLNDLKPNEAQNEYASSLGIDGSNMNRGEMASAISDAGGSLSAFNAMGMNDSPSTGAQLDYASSYGIDGSGMTAGQLYDAVEEAGGSTTVFSMLGGQNGVPPTASQIQYANSLGIDATGMSKAQLGNAVMKAGGNQIRFNRAGGMSGADAIAVNRASMMNTKNYDKYRKENSRGVGNFFDSKASAFQNTARNVVNRSRYRRRW